MAVPSNDTQQYKPQPQPHPWRLPISRFRERIVDKVKLNRVTLIVADTGSGKSSQVPQMLLEDGLGPILCTQPRRLAVVAVSRLVAEQRGCHLGEEVGYHIGQKKVVSSRSCIVFETAGIFLEELICQGSKAASPYKVIVLDEVHERSIESDMVLAFVKQLIIKKTSIRLVLMSATADALRYKDYFNDIEQGEEVEVVPIPNLSSQLQGALFSHKVCYLGEVLKMLGREETHCLSVINEDTELLTAEKQMLIRDLIMHIHENNAESNGSVLVFLPTYKALEQQWSLLKDSGMPLKLYVLHSSIDMECSIRAMEACPEKRKVILATNVAESSLTIPGVSYVIDSCCSVEIYWDNAKSRHFSKLRWESQSQAEQRKGRTGRTCNGTVYRMVTMSLYHTLDKFETPAMQLLSLRKQVLQVLCSGSKLINEPKAFFLRVLDPPAQEKIIDALNMLESINAIALSRDNKRKYVSTLYGKLLVRMPLSLEMSIMVINGGQMGYLKESIFAAAMIDTNPMPISRPFGEEEKYKSLLENFYDKCVSSDDGMVDYLSIVMANINAYYFWQRAFKVTWMSKGDLAKEFLDEDVQRLERLAKSHAKHSSGDRGFSLSFPEKCEQQWCLEHSISLSAMHNIDELSSIIMECLHRYRPRFLNQASGPPLYYRAYEFLHFCSLSCDEEIGKLSLIDQDDLEMGAGLVCCEKPFVMPQMFQKEDMNTNLKILIKEARNNSFHSSQASGNNNEAADELFSSPPCRFFQRGSCMKGDFCLFSHLRNTEPPVCTYFMSQDARNNSFHSSQASGNNNEAADELFSSPPCRFFQRGSCMKGDFCLFSHSRSTEPPVCTYFMSQDGCRYGDNCHFLHGETSISGRRAQSSPEFDEETPSIASFLNMIFATSKNSEQSEVKRVFLFGEGDFSFTEKLALHSDPENIIATSWEALSNGTGLNNRSSRKRVNMLIEDGVEVYEDVDSLALSRLNIEWDGIASFMWLIKCQGDDSDSEAYRGHISDFFTSISRLLFSSVLPLVQVILVMYNSQYSQLQVERLARNNFFFLSQSLPFDTATFGSFSQLKSIENIGSVSEVKPVTYVFELQPPSSVLHGDYWEYFSS